MKFLLVLCACASAALSMATLATAEATAPESLPFDPGVVLDQLSTVGGTLHEIGIVMRPHGTSVSSVGIVAPFGPTRFHLDVDVSVHYEDRAGGLGASLGPRSIKIGKNAGIACRDTLRFMPGYFSCPPR